MGYHFRGSTHLDYFFHNPTASLTSSAVNLSASSPHPSTNLTPWTTALPGNDWDVVTLQPFYGGGSVGPSTLGSDVAAINGMIASAQSNAANASTRFYIYATWPFVTYGALDSYGNAWLSPTQNTDSHVTLMAREYFADLADTVRQTHPNVLVIPAGEVFYTLDVKMQAGLIPGFASVQDLRRDSIHLNSLGQNVTSYTAYATLFGQSPLGLPNDVFASGGSFPEVPASPEALAIIQQTVWDVVNAQSAYTGVPEPASGFLILAGLTVLSARHFLARRRSRSR